MRVKLLSYTNGNCEGWSIGLDLEEVKGQLRDIRLSQYGKHLTHNLQ